MNKMRISTVHILLLGVLVAGLAPTAHALKLEGFKLSQPQDGIPLPEVRVNFDRTADTWNQVTGDDVVVKVDYEIEVKSVYALAAGSKISMSLDNMHGQVQLQSTNNHYGEVHSGTITLRRSGNATNEIKAAALSHCQSIRKKHGKPSKEHRIGKRFWLSARANASNVGPLYSGDSATRQLGIDIILICNEDPGWQDPSQVLPSGIAIDRGPFKPEKLELFLTTYPNQVTHPAPGASCKKLYVKVRIEANREGVASYKLWRKPGETRSGMPMTKFHNSGPFKGRFIAEDVFVDTFDSTTYVQYMAEMGGTFGLSTPWKDIHIVCSSSGGLSGAAPPGGGPEPTAPGRLKAPSTTPPPPPVPPVKKTPQRAPTG
ncbi:MAG TPA: hypothetical protein VFS58_10145 [Steroidobacteraceae bacterium]|nr:hypothetical protein [Steroidobacteraceae bacterium]